jgi:hypothetical protein
VLRLNPSLRPGAEEFLHTPMPEVPDHMYSVAIHAT